MKSKRGFTFLETLIAVVILSVGTALAIKPIKGLMLKMKLQTVANGMKHTLMNARLRAVANPDRQCGVMFVIGSATQDDTVFAFLDRNPPDKIYTKGQDSLYLAPFVVKKGKKVTSTLLGGSPTTIVFRGDGSASSSLKLKLAMGNLVDTLDVLASTGRVRVGYK